MAAAHAQTPQAPPMTSVLAGKKFTPPFKGTAEVDFTKPVSKNEKGMVTTTIMVKNNASGPLLRLTVDETWYDDKGGLVTGGKGVINRLEAGEVGTIKIETPYNAKMKANNYNFSHANGAVKPHNVPKLTAATDKDAAAKPAPAAPKKK
ncbi:MAG TPA: hypothetical protein VGJ88_09305 [Thermoanaerobaculia bacterium]